MILSRKILVSGVLLWSFFAGFAPLRQEQAHAVEAKNVRLVGYCDLQGRETLQVSLKGNYAYVGHHRGDGLNPLTNKVESNGTSIVDVSDPKEPKVVKHIPGYKGSESRAVQVVGKYFDGKDYILRNQESSEFTGFEVWDVTDKANPKRISTIGPLHAAHKSWWDAKTGYAYLSGIWPGWRGQHLIIYDLRDPANPKFVTHWGLPGQRPGDPSKGGLSLHHPVISGNRAYLSYLQGGDMVILDIADKSNPKMIAHLNFSPPFSGIHTTVPFNNMKVPNFTRGFGDIRNFLVVSEEAFDGGYTCQGLRKQLYVVDATEETSPIPVATFKVPDGDFCERGGWFGPHQFAETKDGEIIGGALIFVAYFSGGLRVVDISDPFHPKEVGFFIPDTTEKTKPRLKKVIQTNDVDLDYRGLIYITDRAGTGLHILEYTGGK
ncbi:MAG: hypothetical protein ABSF48_24275 [Thermodesulfobacteriota bacterium]|jgi:hypothetical protein